MADRQTEGGNELTGSFSSSNTTRRWSRRENCLENARNGLDWSGMQCSRHHRINRVGRYTTPPVVQPRRSLALIALHKSYAWIGEHAQGLSAYGARQFSFAHIKTSLHVTRWKLI